MSNVQHNSSNMKSGLPTGPQIYLKYFQPLKLQLCWRDITSFRTEKKPVLLEAYFYVIYSGSPVLRRPSIIRSETA
jgi:hypothetical protein